MPLPPKEVMDALTPEEKAIVKRKVRVEDVKQAKLEAAKLPKTIFLVEYALREYRGNLTYAAKMLECKRHVLLRYIQSNPYLMRVLDSINEETLDQAEWMLMKQVNEGNMAAISLTLKTKGKERGYTERNTVEHEIGGKMKNSAALIEAMRKGLTGPVETEEVIEGEEYKWVEPVEAQSQVQES